MRLFSIAALLLPALVAGNVRLAAQALPQVPAGFHTSAYVTGLLSPTAIAFGPDSRLYVAEQGGDVIEIGRARRHVIASGLAVPLGLAWHRHKLYVSWTGHVSTLTPNKSYLSFRQHIVVRGLPTGKHQNDGIAFHSGWMYLGVGSTCNACAESNARSATIMRFRDNGSQAQIFAHGLRNPYGLAFRPGTSQLYATDNGRDDHDDSVPDELNRIVRGRDYGWPGCWGNGGGSHCKGTAPPVALLEPHASADGIAFYTGRSFPKPYRSDAFIAEWGNDVTALYTGHRVKRVHFSGNRLAVSDFATGLDHPLAVAIAPTGALLAADYGTGIIWAIQANGH